MEDDSSEDDIPLRRLPPKKGKKGKKAPAPGVNAKVAAPQGPEKQQKKQKVVLSPEELAAEEARKEANRVKRAAAEVKRQYKAGRKAAIENCTFTMSGAEYNFDAVPFNQARLEKDAVVVHVFDADTPQQNFCIGILNKARGKGKKFWVKYPVDNTEVLHNLAQKDYLNFWAFVKLTKSAAEVNDEVGQSQES